MAHTREEDLGVFSNSAAPRAAGGISATLEIVRDEFGAVILGNQQAEPKTSEWAEMNSANHKWWDEFLTFPEVFAALSPLTRRLAMTAWKLMDRADTTSSPLTRWGLWGHHAAKTQSSRAWNQSSKGALGLEILFQDTKSIQGP